MSFYFDVWTKEAFILASDARLITNAGKSYLNKIRVCSQNSRIQCAIVVCGDYPENPLNFFLEASLKGNTLRDIAHCFANKWTERYAGHNDISAVHLVGFESIPNTDLRLPQMWHWENRNSNEEILAKQLKSFTDSVPAINHIPWKVQEVMGKPPGKTLQEEYENTMTFLSQYQPYFTWNGDTRFWDSALAAIGGATNLLSQLKPTWTLEKTCLLIEHCIEFLSKIGNLSDESTVGPGPSNSCDVLVLSPGGSSWHRRA
jgi:hypothetical protein